jgi:hypothetical protein
VPNVALKNRWEIFIVNPAGHMAGTPIAKRATTKNIVV